ncbi:hypothetical protein IMCC26134_04000 [Verrucomicrobia bacterium IMCC26134]|nr:hypothetical protein IMCC26134_04000 [Verrucomicrobia bacterium IMCC26134]
MIMRPVEVVRALPKEAVKGTRYYVEGPDASASGTKWKTKLKRIGDQKSGEIAFSDADLNAWAANTFKKVELEKGAAPSFALLAGIPNFRVEGDQLQVGTVNDLIVLGGVCKLVIEAKGSFTKGANGWSFIPTEVYFGGLPTHKFPLLNSMLMGKFGAVGMNTPEATKVLADATSINMSEGSVVVKLP